MEATKTTGKSPWRRFLLAFLSSAIRLWWRTLFIRIDPAIGRFTAEKGPFLVALWHRDIFSTGEIYHRIGCGRRMFAMVSPSGDGEWLAALFERIGIHSLRGSSGRGAARVYGAALKCIGSGNDLAITPDGPRGPRCRCKGGIVRMAVGTATPIMALSVKYGAAFRLSTWDRMRIPLPFSTLTVRVSYVEPATLASLESQSERESLIEGTLLSQT
ncbi:MAG: DUF374 domain-containing protein [Puniceicoccales bacterium]|jgi:lysophospholipid acyltransferase (LPLAT)-like uncharacterized protein|nr:DUF374 domain-containing protein [Puniceicoccales bacterium]